LQANIVKRTAAHGPTLEAISIKVDPLFPWPSSNGSGGIGAEKISGEVAGHIGKTNFKDMEGRQTQTLQSHN
jgi:hypothetical protein